MWSLFLSPTISLAAAFCTAWRGLSSFLGRPTRRLLFWSRWVVTCVCITVFVSSSFKYQCIFPIWWRKNYDTLQVEYICLFILTLLSRWAPMLFTHCTAPTSELPTMMELISRLDRDFLSPKTVNSVLESFSFSHLTDIQCFTSLRQASSVFTEAFSSPGRNERYAWVSSA